MINDDFDRAVATAATMSAWCRCGDHESDHIEGVFVARHQGAAPGRACIVPFCRCGAFTPMTAWQLPERDDTPEEAGP